VRASVRAIGQAGARFPWETTAMNETERRLCFAGMLMFVLALLLGFAIAAFPRPDAAKGVHIAGLEMGTFLIAAGLLWPKLALARWTNTLAMLLVASFYLLGAGLLWAALEPAAKSVTPPLILQIVASVVMLGVTVATLFCFSFKSR
jgi:hypothetical protein